MGGSHNQNRGATALTYGLVVGLVGIGSLAAVTRIGDSIDSLFGATSSTLTSTVDKAEATATPSPTATPTPLFAFGTHTFTTCGATGRTGPAQSSCRSAYNTAAEGNWDEDAAHFSVSAGIQLWTVPVTGSYRIRAAGARGGANSTYTYGRGAIITGTFTLTQGDQLKILVGQAGHDNTGERCDAGSGGGTFVTTSGNDPLIIAGGGSGASINQAGKNGQYGTSGGGSSYGSGGSNGAGGSSSGICTPYGVQAGGGGLLTDGAQGCWVGFYGRSFINGGTGGDTSDANSIGGFGGGGGGHGNCWGGSAGAGGYSGGGGGGNNQTPSLNETGGGGGSFNAGSDTSEDGYNSGHGSVQITKL